jgi:biopolymer transport protein ExbB
VFGDRALTWHFAQDGAPQDASGHGMTGSATGARDPAGLIGQALELDGKSGVGLPTSFALTSPATVSMWVKPAAAKAGGTLFAQSGGLTVGLADGVPYLQVGAQKTAAGSALTSDGWTYVAAVADGQKTTLYVDGQAAGEIAGALPAGSGQASVGQGFAGDIDEVEVSKSALPAGAIAQALTPDAWVVIILLAIMSLVSWVVMVTKGLTLGRIAAANEAFLDAYESAAIGGSQHDGLVDLPAKIAASGSSLAHLYRVGQGELNRRLKEGKATGSRFALRAQSIAAIRSALDATQVREGQKLNSQMVLLTIAISGGPFIGLLGTVLGVMITFAAVAAAGDVNINAIAPGIAAALLATVTGLAVAIPALFGYNYLVSRIEEISADDQIFVDELEKRIAETWQDAPAALHAAQ